MQGAVSFTMNGSLALRIGVVAALLCGLVALAGGAPEHRALGQAGPSSCDLRTPNAGFEGSSAVPPGQPPAPSGAATPAASGVYLGVWQPGAPEQMQALARFEQDAGRQMAFVMYWRDWAASGDLNLPWLCAIRAHGSVPLITWMPTDFRPGVDVRPFSLQNIAAGRQDGYVLSWARQLAAYGAPVLLRFAHEMNGVWYNYGQVGTNTPADFIAAWRHVHDLFVAAGATNVQWVWSPNVAYSDASAFEPYYPGDAYVDWVALDGYNPGLAYWQWFAEIFGDSYTRLLALTHKPVMIAEVGSAEASPEEAAQGETKAEWIRRMLEDDLPNQFSQVRALVWFNENKLGQQRDGWDERIETSPESLAAFRDGIASSYYRSSFP